MTKLFATISLLFLLLNCENSKEIDTYKIYNAVLKEKVSTYGIMAYYLPFEKDYSEKELDKIAEKKTDSLIKSKSLTYFLSNQLTVLDTINPSDQLFTADENDINIEFKTKFSKNKLDFARLEKLEIGNRLDKEKEINANQKKPTYLGSYDLSEPIFISNDKAVIKYQHHCGSKCGVGILIYLKKENDEWKIVDEKMIWIS